MIRPDAGMVLAAGRGERLRPITDTLPKPLVEVGGRTLLDHALDRLEAAGVGRVVVNLHYRAEQIRAHLAGRPSPEILFSPEPDGALETGGGIVRALPLIGQTQPFFVVNGDALWLDGKSSALRRLAGVWDEARHDAVLLFQRAATAVGHDHDAGDFLIDRAGVPRRRGENEIAPYLYAGAQLVSPRLFADAPAGPFSINRLWDRALGAGRLAAIVHDGAWFHVSTPAGLDRVRERFGRMTGR